MVIDETHASYAIKLPAFEGPLDLLLHLTKKNEINLYDIPISMITRQYLEYLDLMKSMNLAVAGEFLVMAATLIHIKSKMLLPPCETDEEEEEEDPRADLATRLLEYQQYKEAAEGLETREKDWRDVFGRSSSISKDGPPDEISLVDLNLFDLMEALKVVLDRTPGKRGLEIVVDELSVQDRMGVILDRLEGVDSVTFTSLFNEEESRLAVIVTFLALLELIRLKRIQIVQSEPLGTIRLWKTTN